MSSSGARALLVLTLAVSASSCGTGRGFRSHLSGSTWGEGVTTQARDPWQWGTEATLVAALPVALILDEEIRKEAPEQDYFSSDTGHIEDIASPALGVTPLFLGAWTWIEGDQGRGMEVATESMLLTLVSTHGLKLLVGRERPNGGNDDSFPSGHTSWAFAGATYIGRFVDQRYDSSLGYLAYLPAAAVGLARMEHSKHWASDVVFGALLGTFLTNLVWNAHYGPGEHALYGEPPKAAWGVAPLVYEGGVGLSLNVSL